MLQEWGGSIMKILLCCAGGFLNQYADGNMKGCEASEKLNEADFDHCSTDSLEGTVENRDIVLDHKLRIRLSNPI